MKSATGTVIFFYIFFFYISRNVVLTSQIP